jgi:transcriptional regulator with XRE-family HTH domain
MIKNLRKLRLEKGISQQQLANEVWVTQQSINKYENHKIEPDIEMLIKIADYFETSVDYLTGHTDIDRVIENVRRYDLGAAEYELIDNYRKLSPKQRESIESIIDNYLELLSR